MVATHDATLKRVGLPTMRTLVARIVDTFDQAMPSDVEAGAAWYVEARELALSFANNGVDVERAACVISHLSPRTSWTRNVEGAVALLAYGERGNGIIGANFERAVSALAAEDPWSTFGPTAPKTLNFARNIAGDDEAVTVDVWAARVVGCDESTLSRVGIYDAIAHAYRLAARRRGVSPATMQATTWIVARGGRAD